MMLMMIIQRTLSSDLSELYGQKNRQKYGLIITNYYSLFSHVLRDQSVISWAVPQHQRKNGEIDWVN